MVLKMDKYYFQIFAYNKLLSFLKISLLSTYLNIYFELNCKQIGLNLNIFLKVIL